MITDRPYTMLSNSSFYSLFIYNQRQSAIYTVERTQHIHKSDKYTQYERVQKEKEKR